MTYSTHTRTHTYTLTRHAAAAAAAVRFNSHSHRTQAVRAVRRESDLGVSITYYSRWSEEKEDVFQSLRVLTVGGKE